MCQSLAWGGFDGTPQCASLSATVIAAEDRMCQTDADCALVAVTQCSAHAVNVPAVPRYATYPAPCSHPLNAFCGAKTFRAACDRGCCVPTTAPPSYGSTVAPAVDEAFGGSRRGSHRSKVSATVASW